MKTITLKTEIQSGNVSDFRSILENCINQHHHKEFGSISIDIEDVEEDEPLTECERDPKWNHADYDGKRTA